MEWNKMVPEITVSNFEASLNFYTRLLGFRICYQRENPLFAYLDLDGVQVMLEQKHERGWNTAEIVYPFGRGINFQMEVDDVEKIASSLKAANVTLYREPKESWYATGDDEETGQKEFLVQDPDGYLLRFGQSLGDRKKK